LSILDTTLDVDTQGSLAYFDLMTKPNVYLVGGEIDRREQEYNETILRNLVRLIETGNNVKEKYNQDMEPFGVEAISTDGTMKIFIYRANNEPHADITFYEGLNDINLRKDHPKPCQEYIENMGLWAGPSSETFMLNQDGSITRSVYKEFIDHNDEIRPEFSILIDREEMIEDDDRDAFIKRLESIYSL